jgi:lysine decarboxylase
LSNEISIAYMDNEGREKLEYTLGKVDEIIERLKKIDRVNVFTGDENDETIYAKDNTKILISIDGMTGSNLKRKMYKDHNIRLEMADYYYALMLTSAMNNEEDFEKAVEAIEKIAKNEPYEEINKVSIKMPTPKVRILPSEAYFSQKQQIMLEDAVGRIAAAPVIPYPPGIPLIVPGEEITKEISEHLTFLMENGIEVVGLMGENKDSIVVVE